MTKTTWIITDLNENIKTELTYYHFGKNLSSQVGT